LPDLKGRTILVTWSSAIALGILSSFNPANAVTEDIDRAFSVAQIWDKKDPVSGRRDSVDDRDFCLSGCEGSYYYEGERTVLQDVLIRATRSESGEWEFEIIESSGSEAADRAALETARNSNIQTDRDSIMIRANIAENEREAEDIRRRIQQRQEEYRQQQEAVYGNPAYHEPAYQEPIDREPANYKPIPKTAPGGYKQHTNAPTK